MLIRFDERFELPAGLLYGYFRSPTEWPRLYRAFGDAVDGGDGWYTVPLRRFPVPLTAKITDDQPNRRVEWTFKGFWRGRGEVRFVSVDRGTQIQGYEEISIRALPVFSGLLERMFLERRFRALWASGWERLRREATREDE